MAEAATYTVRLTDGSEYGPAEMDLLVRWAQQGRIPTESVLVPTEPGDARSVLDVPELARLVQAPPTISSGVPAQDDGGPLSGVIPYRNPPALIGYYLAVFSLIPFFGILLGAPAFVLGIVGLRRRLKNPRLKGAAHAWIAIIGGALTTLVWIGLVVTIMVGLAATARP